MFTGLLGVVVAGPGRPFGVGVFPRVRLPTIVLEIVLGIVICPSAVGWAKPDVVLARELLDGLEPELYGQVASAERLRLKVAGWLLRHVRPRDAITVDRRRCQREASVCRTFRWVYRPVLASYASVDAVARHRARPRRTHPTAPDSADCFGGQLYGEGKTDDRIFHAGPRGEPHGPAHRARHVGPAGRGGPGRAEPRLGAAR